MRVERIGDCTLYLGDCRDILPTLSRVDCVITDPPYGVALGSRANNNRARESYESCDDTPEFVRDIASRAVALAISKSTRGLVTPGVRNMRYYDEPAHVGAIYYPAASGCNKWGFSCWQPMFFYGPDPQNGRGSLPDSFQSTERVEPNGHPCPKPIGQMLWMVNRASQQGETILDPFMGSGTTGVACVQTGRKFIGIEKEPKYFDIACRAISRAVDFTKCDLFKAEKPIVKQPELFPV